MKFSVLMSLYNKEQPQFLAQCLQSLVEQSLPASEIVLVLDGEINPNLRQVIAQYQPQLPLKLVELAQNVGLGRALNAGIAQCQHEWILRMDTDDICHRQRFAKQIAYIQSHQVDIVGTQLAEFEKDYRQLSGERLVPTSEQEIIQFAKRRSPFNHPTVAYRKSMLQTLSGYQHHLFLEDYNLWLRIIAQGYKVANLPDVLLYMRVGNGMVGRRKGWQYIKSEWKLAKLKRQLKIEHTAMIVIHFMLRSIVRLLPTNVLKRLYQRLHKKQSS